jgi:hypothetical protein
VKQRLYRCANPIGAEICVIGSGIGKVYGGEVWIGEMTSSDCQEFVEVICSPEVPWACSLRKFNGPSIVWRFFFVVVSVSGDSATRSFSVDLSNLRSESNS